MNVGALVSRFKDRARERSTKRYENQASDLADLRKERVRVEGQNKISDLKRKEREGLRVAKKKRFEGSGVGQLVAGVKSNFKESQKKSKGKSKSDVTPFSIGGTSPYALNKPKVVAPVKKNKRRGTKVVVYVR